MKASISFMLAALMLMSSPAFAKGKHPRSRDVYRSNQTRRVEIRGADRLRGRYFAPGDVRILREYYEPRGRELPPGLQKKLYRTGRLPPGWEKKLRPFPPRLERRLVGVPRHYRRGFLDDYAIVYDPRTRVIVDIAIIGR